MSLTVTIIILAFLILLLIANRIPWRDWAIKWVKYNPQKGVIYIKTGMYVTKYFSKRFYEADEGQMYYYDQGKIKEQVVIIPKQYPHIDIAGYRMIGLEDGHLVANPLGFFDPVQMAKYREGKTDISALARGNNMIMAMHSVKSHKTSDILKWALVAIIVVGAYLGYQHFIAKPAVQTSPTANMTSPANVAPLNPPGEVVIK